MVLNTLRRPKLRLRGIARICRPQKLARAVSVIGRARRNPPIIARTIAMCANFKTHLNTMLKRYRRALLDRHPAPIQRRRHPVVPTPQINRIAGLKSRREHVIDRRVVQHFELKGMWALLRLSLHACQRAAQFTTGFALNADNLDQIAAAESKFFIDALVAKLNRQARPGFDGEDNRRVLARPFQGRFYRGVGLIAAMNLDAVELIFDPAIRSEERRVGDECCVWQSTADLKLTVAK